MRKLIPVNIIYKERLPEGRDCGSCKHYRLNKEYDSYYCYLFNAWLHPYMRVVSKEIKYSAYKCNECLEAIGKSVADPDYCADTRK